MLDLLRHFGVTPRRVAREHPLPGSPERCLSRTVAEADDGRLWMLERIAPAQAVRRERMGALLCALTHTTHGELAGLVPAYLPVVHEPGGAAASGSGVRYVLHVDGAFGPEHWQASPFISGFEPPRPDYLDHAWRGQAVAALLLAIIDAGRALPEGIPAAPVPPLPAYIASLHEAAARRAPAAARRLHPVRAALEALPDALAAQPVVLAHGDIHPLNLIWADAGSTPPAAEGNAVGADFRLSALRGVIDWEFAGAQPLFYDAANCIGCAGFEHPTALGRGFASALVDGLRQGLAQRGLGAGRDAATQGAHVLRHLPLMVLASRFGWVSEWLRRNDQDMLGMELDYCDILLRWQPELTERWSGR